MEEQRQRVVKSEDAGYVAKPNREEPTPSALVILPRTMILRRCTHGARMVPNVQVSDGWPDRTSQTGKAVLGQTFAPPKSYAIQRSPIRANSCGHVKQSPALRLGVATMSSSSR